MRLVGASNGSVGTTTMATKGLALSSWGYQLNTMRPKNKIVQAANKMLIKLLLALSKGRGIAVTNFYGFMNRS
jgi:hypothetical protein